ncbi:MAG: hypothetical protein J6P19_08980 [Acetobacter sp.]|nr:hypothetical protein [Acetobacter sp.]
MQPQSEEKNKQQRGFCTKILNAFTRNLARFDHVQRRRLSKKGSIAIEGAVCTLAAIMLLGVMYNLSMIYICMLHAQRMAGDAARGLINGQSMSSGVVQNLISDIAMEDGLDNGSTVQVSLTQVQGLGGIYTYYGGGGCAGPGGHGSEWILQTMQEGSNASSIATGMPKALAFAQVNACVPMPTTSFINLATFGFVNIPQTPLTAHAFVIIPKPPNLYKK